jgi:hypothetical protein
MNKANEDLKSVFVHYTREVISPLKQPEPKAGKLSRATAIAVVYIPLTIFLRGYLCDGGAVTVC